MPIQDLVEMGMTLPALETKLRNTAYYPPLFQKAFGTTDITSEKLQRPCLSLSVPLYPIVLNMMQEELHCQLHRHLRLMHRFPISQHRKTGVRKYFYPLLEVVLLVMAQKYLQRHRKRTMD